MVSSGRKKRTTRSCNVYIEIYVMCNNIMYFLHSLNVNVM